MHLIKFNVGLKCPYDLKVAYHKPAPPIHLQKIIIVNDDSCKVCPSYCAATRNYMLCKGGFILKCF